MVEHMLTLLTTAAKYKEYNKLRDVIAGKILPPSSPKPARKRKSADITTQTPVKTSKHTAITPQKQAQDVQSPSTARILFTPQHLPAVIGPTPQRDGQVLGLFDLLPAATPSRTQRQILGDVQVNVVQTPTKEDDKNVGEAPMTGRLRGSRTPTSTGKRFLLDSFVTPKKRKLGEEGTPSSSMKKFATPSFLRRCSAALDTVAEEEAPSPEARPWKRKGLGRSLSAIITSMRKEEEEREEERLDEDLEMMREMEREEAAVQGGKAGPAGIGQKNKPDVPSVQVEDSQDVMKLGPDGAYISEEENKLGDGEAEGETAPRRRWKKKGQKRTTRRVKSGSPNSLTRKFFLSLTILRSASSAEEVDATIGAPSSQRIRRRHHPGNANRSLRGEGRCHRARRTVRKRGFGLHRRAGRAP